MKNKDELIRKRKQKLNQYNKNKNSKPRITKKENSELILKESKGVDFYLGSELDEREFTTVYGLLAELAQYIEVGDILTRIETGKTYTVEIPSFLKEKFRAGEFFSGGGKTGSVFSSLMEMAEDGKQKFVGNMPLKEDASIDGKPMQDIAVVYHNLYTQREIAYIASTVEKTFERVEKIEHGQMDDRIAKLQSGREQILLALNLNDEEEKKDAIRLGRRDMIEAKNQIGKALERRVREFEPLPKDRLKIVMRQVRDAEYLDHKDDEVEEIQDYYNLYLEATKLITASYVYSGEEAAARQVATESKKFLGNIDFDNLKSIKRIHKNEDLGDMFFNAPVEYLEIEEKEVLEMDPNETIRIEVKGEQLLEVFDNESE